MIKHLVLSGGGSTLFISLGIVQQLQKDSKVIMNEIQSIYGTSAGAMVAVILCLKFDWETINDYVINRPWNDAYPIDVNSIFEAYTKKGLFDRKLMEIFFKPLFDTKDVSMEITMLEFYQHTGVEIHMYSFEMNEFKIVDISYKTHPELTLLTALHMTCAVPTIITPVCVGDKCYIDGGVTQNYPIKYCINSPGCKPEEVLGIKNEFTCETYNITTESTMIDFITCFLFKLVFFLMHDTSKQPLLNEVVCKSEIATLSYIKKVVHSRDLRRELLESGIELGKKYVVEKKVL
jgi:hypothetical protein